VDHAIAGVASLGVEMRMRHEGVAFDGYGWTLKCQLEEWGLVRADLPLDSS
jgi:hypothetical protein